MIRRLHCTQRGFTIVELVISTGIAAVLAAVLLTISLYYFGETVRSRITAELAVESHYVLRAMVEDIRLADGLGASNSIADSNAPGGTWSMSDADNVFIIDSPAVDASRSIIYDPLTGYPYRNNLVYFVGEKNLYKRILKNESAADNVAVTTCPEGSSTSSCPTDRKYSTHIDDVTFAFYDELNAETADPSLARSVQISVTLSRPSFGKVITFENTIYTALRNY